MPPFAWQTATPESRSMSGPKLDVLRDALAARKTTAFLVVRNDRIVYEWYADGHGPARIARHGVAGQGGRRGPVAGRRPDRRPDRPG